MMSLISRRIVSVTYFQRFIYAAIEAKAAASILRAEGKDVVDSLVFYHGKDTTTKEYKPSDSHHMIDQWEA